MIGSGRLQHGVQRRPEPAIDQRGKPGHVGVLGCEAASNEINDAFEQQHANHGAAAEARIDELVNEESKSTSLNTRLAPRCDNRLLQEIDDGHSTSKTYGNPATQDLQPVARSASADVMFQPQDRRLTCRQEDRATFLAVQGVLHDRGNENDITCYDADWGVIGQPDLTHAGKDVVKGRFLFTRQEKLVVRPELTEGKGLSYHVNLVEDPVLIHSDPKTRI